LEEEYKGNPLVVGQNLVAVDCVVGLVTGDWIGAVGPAFEIGKFRFFGYNFF
jgi:hypothetical protein